MTLEITDTVQRIPIASINPDLEQPRKYFDEAQEQRLTDSIMKYGLIQLILVRPIKHSTCKYEIVCGERRYRAHKRLGLSYIKTIVQKVEDTEVLDLQLLENIQRKDLTNIELACMTISLPQIEHG